MSKKNLDYKDIVGKLMSQENISVVHLTGAKTASFDISKRTLYLPEFINVSEDVYDLLIGHEVSHALHTPQKGWHDTTEEKGQNFKTFLNVVEDVRIEKMIQKKFPGLRGSFKRGYRDLFNMDLFGIKGKSKEEIGDLLLIDRLNLYFKLGQIQSGVSFKKEEEVFVNEMSNLKTWEDVVSIAEKLFEYCKKEMEEKNQEEESDEKDSPSTGFSDDIISHQEDSTEDKTDSRDESNGGEVSTGKLENEEFGENDVNSQNQSQDEIGKIDKEEPFSLTDMNFRENESKLNYVDDDNRPYYFSAQSSEDLPILYEEYFYDDWKKIYNQITENIFVIY